MGTWTRVETRGRTNDGNEYRSGDENEGSVAKMRTGTRIETGTGTRTGFGGETKNRKMSHKICRRNEANGESVSGKMKKVDKNGLVQSLPTQGLRKNCTSREGVSPLLRLIRGFRNEYR